jgi:hypothetical protein
MLERVANWHGEQAVKAYRARRYKDFRRHARIADSLWPAK